MSGKPETLHEHEKKVLLALKKEGSATQEQLCELTGLPMASVSHASLWLSSKRLVEVQEQTTRYVQLNQEGKEYLKNGLPERQALEQVKKGVNTIKQLKEKLGNKKTGIALTWLMKKKLATIKKGVINLTPAGKKALKTRLPQEKILEKLSTKQKASELQDLKTLEERGKIVCFSESTKRKVSLTGKGKKLLEKGVKTKKTVNVLNTQLIKTGKWKKAEFRPYDLQAPAPPLKIGKKQPYLCMIDQARKKLVALGFTEVRGPIIETEFWDFDVLYQPQFHPTRTPSDTYYLKKPVKGKLPEKLVKKVKDAHENGGNTGSTGWRYKWNPKKAAQLILRTHTTSCSARAMANNKSLPAKYFTISRNFRRDVIDATHLPEFFQLDGIIIQENMTFKELLGMLKEFAVMFAGTDQVKFRPAYFPYTEPSVEIVARHPQLGDVELGGAGMFRPEVRLPLGIKAEVMAWGLGFDRFSMMKLGLKDIRQLFSTDLKWLENTVVGVD
jgi:phenylalanyl-tRNA synthetase alpha chain